MTWIPPGPFGPISIQTQLDGSGNGNVSFQANGRNARLTRVVVAVATSVKQASVSIYKGQIGTSNFIGSIVSGSTGGIASGQIDLTDGQTVYVVWSGGDASAIATATFSGNAVALSDIGNDSITWTDPIAASDGTLIFPAIKSVNYVAGVSGWMFDRDGNIDANAGTFRGEVDINGTDGSQVAITASSGHAEIDLMPPAYTPPVTNFPAEIGAGSNGTGNGSYGSLSLSSPRPLGASTSALTLLSSTIGGTSVSTIVLQADEIDLGTSGTTIKSNGAPLPGTWVAGGALTANSAGVAATETAMLTAKDANNNQPTFLANHYYKFVVEGQAQSTVTTVGPILGIRKTNSTGTRYKWARQNTTTAGNPYAAHIEGEFQVGPSGQAADIILTLAGAAGQTVTIIAATDNPCLFNIYDMGLTTLQKSLYLPVL